MMHTCVASGVSFSGTVDENEMADRFYHWRGFRGAMFYKLSISA